jgi:hypothetical protein
VTLDAAVVARTTRNILTSPGRAGATLPGADLSKYWLP